MRSIEVEVIMLANRVVAVDHVATRTHLLALDGNQPTREDADAERWLSDAEAVVRGALCAPPAAPPERARAAGDGAGPLAPVRFCCGRGRRQYLADIAQCQTALAAGEPSYEVAGAP